MLRNKYCSEISEKDYSQKVQIAGWLQEIRVLGNIAFLILRDRYGTLQITVLKKQNPELFKELTSLPRESIISVIGTVQYSSEARNNYEIIPEKLVYKNVAETPLPLGVVDKVSADLDTRLNHRFIDLRKPEIFAIFKVKSTMLESMHKTFRSEGFIEVHTPKIVASATEGGANLFKINYFDKKAYLSQSPQLYKQMLMATSLERVYEVAPAYRAEEHDTVRHLNEFISIDIEMAFSDEDDVMNVLEKVIYNIISELQNSCKKELELLNVQLKTPQLPFRKITYKETIKLLQNNDFNIQFGEDLGIEALKRLSDFLQDFYFITYWPTKLKPFYVEVCEESELCKSFDLMYKDKEIVSGAKRNSEYEALINSLKAQNLNPEIFQYYLNCFKYGMPPHSGWGLGIERLLMALLNLKNIRECTIFPRDRYRLMP